MSEGLESAQWFRHLLTEAHMARSSLKDVEKESLKRPALVFTDSDSLANTVKKDVGQSHDKRVQNRRVPLLPRGVPISGKHFAENGCRLTCKSQMPLTKTTEKDILVSFFNSHAYQSVAKKNYANRQLMRIVLPRKRELETHSKPETACACSTSESSNILQTGTSLQERSLKHFQTGCQCWCNNPLSYTLRHAHSCAFAASASLKPTSDENKLCAFSTRSRLKHTQTDQACVSFHDHLDRAQKARDIKNFALAPPNKKTHTQGMKQGERQQIWREVIASVWISQFRFNWNSLDRFKQGTSQWASCFALSRAFKWSSASKQAGDAVCACVA